MTAAALSKFTFTFSTYQLSLLAACVSGCITAVEVRGFLREATGEQAGASARRRSYEAIAALEGCGIVRSYNDGTYRCVEILEAARGVVRRALRAAGLEG